MDRLIAVSRIGDTVKERSYMDITGLVSSYHEHSLFEKIDGYASVSAVRALQVASANGIPIQHINSSNITQLLPSLQIAPEIKNDIQNAVNAGKEITVPQTNIQIMDWNGIGYIAKDTNRGSGAYIITGGLGGGSSVSKEDAKKVVVAFIDILTWVRDLISNVLGGTIAEAAELNVGDIVEMANLNVKANPSYNDVGQCSGLVRRAYYAAGICLDSVGSPLGVGCENSLTDKHDIGIGDPITGGAYAHHSLAKHLKINESVRKKDDAKLGDIIFFNTTGPLSHEGIVVTESYNGGQIYFVHATASKNKTKVHDVHRSYMSVSQPNSLQLNSFLKFGCPEGCPVQKDCYPCIASTLWAGFGTVRDISWQASCKDPSHK
jgi:hypothetical protein